MKRELDTIKTNNENGLTIPADFRQLGRLVRAESFHECKRFMTARKDVEMENIKLIKKLKEITNLLDQYDPDCDCIAQKKVDKLIEKLEAEELKRSRCAK